MITFNPQGPLRSLMLDAREDRYFEVWSEEEWAKAMETEGIYDVTKDPVHEKLFQLIKAAK